jgi:hypothetical protein
MPRISDKEMLLRFVPENGDAVGNLSLLKQLEWDERKYWRVRDALVANGLLLRGRGYGGSVRRPPPENKPAEQPAPSKTDSPTSSGVGVRPPTPAGERKQVFVAYSYKLYPKADYRRVYKELEQHYEVTFIFADEKITNMHIMKKIETFIRGSDFSIFDISGWNPNVTLELGFAMAATDQWYIAIDPSKTETQEVPSDLRGLDRIEYDSYDALGNRLRVLMEQRYPKRRREGIDDFLSDRRRRALDLLTENPGLGVQAMSQILEVDVPVVQLILRPLLEEGMIESKGVRRGTKYFPRGRDPERLG